MTAEQLTTIITNILTGSGVLTFMYFLVKSLKREIASLNKTIETQNKTLEVMEKQVAETEKVGAIYKGLIEELPEFVDKYKKFIGESKDHIITELQQANQQKDEKLKESRELDLKRLELNEQMINELPKLRDELIATTQAIQDRFNAISPTKVDDEVRLNRYLFPSPVYQTLFSAINKNLSLMVIPKENNVIDTEYVDVDEDISKPDDPQTSSEN